MADHPLRSQSSPSPSPPPSSSDLPLTSPSTSSASPASPRQPDSSSDRARTVECSTCGNGLDSNEFPEIPKSCQSAHDPTTCRPCWEQWLENQISQVRTDQISCAQCDTKLNQLDVKALATPEVFERYLDAELKLMLSLDENFKWCLSPTCNSGQIHEDGDIFTCTSCGFRQCVQCKTPWHTGRTCEEAQGREGPSDDPEVEALRKRLEDEEFSSKEKLEESSKICPGRGCSRRVEKIDGCDHIKCTMCGYEFCWSCLASHKTIGREGNTAHEAHCPHHSDNLPECNPRGNYPC